MNLRRLPLLTFLLLSTSLLADCASQGAAPPGKYAAVETHLRKLFNLVLTYDASHSDFGAQMRVIQYPAELVFAIPDGD